MTRLRVVVLGMMGRMPFGGQTWLYAHWLRGLADAGHDVVYCEDDSVWPYDPLAQRVTDDCGYAVGHVARTMEGIGLPGRWAFRLEGRDDACWGMAPRALDELYRSCDALLNVVGATDLREEHLRAPFRVYVQTDPVTAELRLDNGDEHTAVAFANHDVIATYGENYGGPDCGVPLDGRRYVKTRQPVDLRMWPAIDDGVAPDFTTIGNYRHEGEDVEWRGETYRWSKHHEWERFVDLPSRTEQPFRMALYVRREEDRALLHRHGWRIEAPHDMSLDVFGAYRRFIQGSRGEFTVAKDQNVRLRSGWFSERDACYLASGRPVVAQDTGFGRALPTGEGLFAVSTVEEAADAIAMINADYGRHARAARAIAEEHLEARRVVERLLADVGLT